MFVILHDELQYENTTGSSDNEKPKNEIEPIKNTTKPLTELKKAISFQGRGAYCVF